MLKHEGTRARIGAGYDLVIDRDAELERIGIGVSQTRSGVRGRGRLRACEKSLPSPGLICDASSQAEAWW